jgi:hypothetical protein
MSTRMQAAILWNNHGARLLQLGDFENAFVWIHSAALIVDGVPMLAASDDDATGGDCARDAMKHWHDCNYIDLDLKSAAHMESTTDHSSRCCAQEQHARQFLQGLPPMNGVLSVYQQPIFLSTRVDSNTTSLDDNASSGERLVHGAILFNLALTSHLSELALVSSDDTEACLEEALELYHCSLGLMDIMDAPDNGTDILGVNVAICKCLILNNMAHVLYELCEYSDSADCVKCLQEILIQAGVLDGKCGPARCDSVKVTRGKEHG